MERASLVDEVPVLGSPAPIKMKPDAFGFWGL
jgi:hypothetical protein